MECRLFLFMIVCVDVRTPPPDKNVYRKFYRIFLSGKTKFYLNITLR